MTVSGDDQRATLSCDWPGCLKSLEIQHVESKESAANVVRRDAAQYYGWRVATVEAGYGQRSAVVLDVCPEHE